MDATYVKALNRRAVAREQLGGDAAEEGPQGEEARATLFKSLVGESGFELQRTT